MCDIITFQHYIYITTNTNPFLLCDYSIVSTEIKILLLESLQEDLYTCMEELTWSLRRNPLYHYRIPLNSNDDDCIPDISNQLLFINLFIAWYSNKVNGLKVISIYGTQNLLDKQWQYFVSIFCDRIASLIYLNLWE